MESERGSKMTGLIAMLMGCMALTGGPARGQGMPNPPAPASGASSPYAVAADANNTFALDLYGQLKTRDAGMGNIFYSPYSISSALAMARIGARGATADQMSATLHLPAQIPVIETSYADLDHLLIGDEQKQGYTLSVANALWGQQGWPFLPGYLNVVKKDFDGDLTAVDFAGHTEAVRLQINQWVADKTHDKIKELLRPGALDPNNRLVLTNAIYFKGQWADPFNVKKTAKEDFRTRKGDLVKADMMHDNRHLLYAEDDLCQMVELPYQGDQLAMLVLLPKAEKPLGNDDALPDPLKIGMVRLESAINSQYLDKLQNNLADRSVNLALPKWNATQEITLKGELAALGMRLAFTPEADFSGMDGRTDLSFSEVIHKAYVNVDEEGTTAAAATAVVTFGAAMHAGPPPVDFTANHSFIYLIVDKPSHAILFAGRLADPTISE